MTPAELFALAVQRRLRLQASIALGEQGHPGGLSVGDVAGLAGELLIAHVAERALRDEAAGSLPIDRISRTLDLSPLGEDVLLAAVTLDRDAGFALSLSALAGGEPRFGLTGKLLAQLFGAPDDDLRALQLNDTHPLVGAGLLVSSEPSLVATLRPWRAPPRVVGYLSGSDEVDPDLRRCGGVIAIPSSPEIEHVAPALAQLTRLLDASDNSDFAIVLEGAAGVGRRMLTALAAAESGRAAVALDLSLASPDARGFAAELDGFARECWLRDAVPVWANLDALIGDERHSERLARVVDAIDRSVGPVVITLAAGSPPTFARRTMPIKVVAPDAATRVRMWHRELPEPSLAGALAELSNRYTLTPALVTRAAANARQLAEHELTAADVKAGISSVIHEHFGGLAAHVEVRQRWDDLVLPADTLDDVRAFISRASNAARVYEEWGFRDKLQRGLGLAALFSGPPGTGKTMVAGLIAKELGLELYMVDLSQVVSKWVGETEKQLGKIFDAAGMGRALLLFDEADALFARRTEVKSSNDRYANLEVNYLLQRIEQFAGVAILTTNLDGSVDPAFKRRMAAEVRFYPPEVAERERLWRALLPAQTPVTGDLDFEELASDFEEMCGGHIRNAVLRAAFLAAAEGTSVTQQHLLRAARTEGRNMGKML